MPATTTTATALVIISKRKAVTPPPAWGQGAVACNNAKFTFDLKGIA